MVAASSTPQNPQKSPLGFSAPCNNISQATPPPEQVIQPVKIDDGCVTERCLFLLRFASFRWSLAGRNQRSSLLPSSFGGFSLRKRNQGRDVGKGVKCSVKVQQQQSSPPPPPAWPGRAFPEPPRQSWDGPKPISIVGYTGSIGTQQSTDQDCKSSFSSFLLANNTLPSSGFSGFSFDGRQQEPTLAGCSSTGVPFMPNVVSYNILLRCLCCDGRWEEANSPLAEMDGGDCAPTVVTYNILINSLVFHGRTEQAMEVLKEMSIGSHQFKVTAMSYNPVIARLCKEGKVDLVVKCLDDMVYRRCRPNEGTFNAIGALCEHKNKVQEAFYIIQSLSNKQKCCTHDLYKSVITSLCRKGNTLAAFQLLHEMTRCGFDPDSHTYSSLIRGLCLEGMYQGAMEILWIMEESKNYKPTVDNFNTMILGYCKSRRTDLALEVFEMMIEKKLMPNETTYAIIVEGIAHEDELELAK